MKVNARGQITLPKAVRDRYGLHPETEVYIEEREDGLLVRAEDSRLTRLQRALHFTVGTVSLGCTVDDWIDHTRQRTA